MQPTFPSVAAFLVAAEGCGGIELVVGVRGYHRTVLRAAQGSIASILRCRNPHVAPATFGSCASSGHKILLARFQERSGGSLNPDDARAQLTGEVEALVALVRPHVGAEALEGTSGSPFGLRGRLSPPCFVAHPLHSKGYAGISRLAWSRDPSRSLPKAIWRCPLGVLLAFWITSSTVRKVCTASTGPKISSCAMRALCATLRVHRRPRSGGIVATLRPFGRLLLVRSYCVALRSDTIRHPPSSRLVRSNQKEACHPSEVS